jgi:hypothetical protein
MHLNAVLLTSALAALATCGPVRRYVPTEAIGHTYDSNGGAVVDYMYPDRHYCKNSKGRPHWAQINNKWRCAFYL